VKTVHKGIREQGKEVDSYSVCISLPARFGNTGKSMLEYDLNDSEEELIRKALHNEQLYVCVADKDYIIYVIEEYEMDADEKAYEYYCDTCFEPGHWSCYKATEEIIEKLGDCDSLLYDDDVLYDLNDMNGGY
jgi:hypothetical protein